MLHAKVQQTVPHGPNLAGYLFLYDLGAKSNFRNFKWMKKSEEQYFMTCDNYLKLKFQCL